MLAVITPNAKQKRRQVALSATKVEESNKLQFSTDSCKFSKKKNVC